MPEGFGPSRATAITLPPNLPTSGDEHSLAFLHDGLAECEAHYGWLHNFFGWHMNATLVRAREMSLALLVTAVVDLRRPCKHVDALATDSSRLLRLGRHLLRSADNKYAEICCTDRVMRHV
jgi:hypothetical protein